MSGMPASSSIGPRGQRGATSVTTAAMPRLISTPMTIASAEIANVP
ncbi:hypothetical protein [Rhizobium leguminosarum]|nr:hypothetical protein [Rhizobium leguminosarum]